MFFNRLEPIFELKQDIIKTNVLTMFHEDWTNNVTSRVLTRKNAPPCGSHVFQQKGTIFKLMKDIICTTVLMKFYYSHIRKILTKKNAVLTGVHVFQFTGTILELV
ncbi:hypothetical protein DPMN_023929 [Dreissena polymorpha]|uniref:Uncharacterized protein n=1 Tax=Dreissena polymorpha TaxID=45954 RepID=A0A9D4LNT6_DREPO|nr:hypothetical protein DPMN_023929 [Dreissena polymorpha]